jgi:DnaJ-class molecular chaperone
MKTPFEILNVDEEASDEEIKQAYLCQVKQYSPEQAPLQFQQIRAAYETIQTVQQRIKYRLFYVMPFAATDVMAHFLAQETIPQRPTADLFMKTLAATLTLPDNK